MTDDPIEVALHPDELLSAYADGELDDTERASVEEHLSHCDACAADLSDIERVRDEVREAPVLAAPDGFVERVIRRRRRASRQGAFLGVAAAVVAVVVGVAFADPADPPAKDSVTHAAPAYDVNDEAKIARFNSGRLQTQHEDAADDDEDDSLLDRASEAASDLLGALSGE